MFGLRDSDISDIIQVLEKFPEVELARIFGSRAKGNYRNGSDVDLAVFGNNISFERIIHISSVLNEETMMPYYFDVLDYYSIENADLVRHIDRIGRIIYSKEKRVLAV